MNGYLVQQSSASYPLLFLLVSSSDHISPVTGATPTVTLSKNGAAFASPAGTVTEIANGWYKVAGNGTDTATLGPLALHATASGADPSDWLFTVVAFNPQSGSNLGLSALPTVAPGNSGGLPTTDASNGVKLSVGTGAGQLNVSGGKAPATMGSTDYSGNTVQTGDSYARIGATGSGLTSVAPSATALSTANWTNTRAGLLDNLDAAVSTRSTYAGGDTSGTTTLLARLTSTRAGLLDNLDATISSRMASGNVTVGGYATGQDPAALVLDVAIAGHESAGSVGAAIAAAGGSGDPWATALPGSYTSGQAGYIIGHNIDAAVSTRSTYAGGAVASVSGNVGGNVAGSVGSVTGAVTVSLTQALDAARNVGPVADTGLTLNDAFHCAIAAAAGKESVVGTTYLVQTPSTGTTLRSFNLDSGTAPTSRS